MPMPKAGTEGCDVALWREDGEVYWMWVKSQRSYRLRGDLSKFIRTFPEDLRLCIMNDETGKFVKILPVAN